MKTFMIYIVTRTVKHDRQWFDPEIVKIVSTLDLAKKTIEELKLKSPNYTYDYEEYEVMAE